MRGCVCVGDSSGVVTLLESCVVNVLLVFNFAKEADYFVSKCGNLVVVHFLVVLWVVELSLGFFEIALGWPQDECTTLVKLWGPTACTPGKMLKFGTLKMPFAGLSG